MGGELYTEDLDLCAVRTCPARVGLLAESTHNAAFIDHLPRALPFPMRRVRLPRTYLWRSHLAPILLLDRRAAARQPRSLLPKRVSIQRPLTDI